MKKITFITAICTLITLTGYTQTKQQSIKELMHIMEQDSTMEKVMNATISGITSRMPVSSNPEMQAKFKEIMQSSMEMSRTIMKKFIDEEMVQIYDRHYTQQEINDYIAFYKSPSGKKLLHSMPEVQKDVMTIVSQKYMPMMMEEIKKKMDEMKKAQEVKKM